MNEWWFSVLYVWSCLAFIVYNTVVNLICVGREIGAVETARESPDSNQRKYRGAKCEGEAFTSFVLFFRLNLVEACMSCTYSQLL